jgi:hypothetical protein
MSDSVAEIMPARARKTLYVAFAVTSAVIAGTLAGFAAIQHTAPLWVTFASAFVLTVGTALGFIAAGNIATPASGSADTDIDQVITDSLATAEDAEDTSIATSTATTEA